MIVDHRIIVESHNMKYRILVEDRIIKILTDNNLMFYKHPNPSPPNFYKQDAALHQKKNCKSFYYKQIAASQP
jgi:hypothetical protein